MSGYPSQEHSIVFLDLPRPWLANLFQHVASGPRGLAHAAALSQSCSSLHALSESSAVSYRNIHVPRIITTSNHPVWKWLAERQGRVSGLNMQVHVETATTQHGPDAADPMPKWTQPLQTLSAIPGLHLIVYCRSTISARDEPFMEEWLKPHAYLMDSLRAEVAVGAEHLSLREFCEAAAPCRSIRLTVSHNSRERLNLSGLALVSGSLVDLDIKKNESVRLCGVENFDTLTSMPKLKWLRLDHVDLTAADPWPTLASLSSLEYLQMKAAANGDPSVLSELTGLELLDLGSYYSRENVDAVPFSFSSLQPLSTLQQLGCLCLSEHAFGATSLQGLAGLRELETLYLVHAPSLVSLEGISGAVTDLFIGHAKKFQDLSSISVLDGLQDLSVNHCGITSLQPLAGLRGLDGLRLDTCPVTSLEGLEGRSLDWLILSCCDSLRQLSGLELSALQRLDISECGVSSLQPLAELTGAVTKLSIGDCGSVTEEVLELPHIQPTADVRVWNSNVKEVVLAGGVRRVIEG